MRTDARIFRVASPLGLGRCCTGGGGCWLCGGGHRHGPTPAPAVPIWPQGQWQRPGTGRSPGRAPAGAAAPACAPSRWGGSRSRTAVLGPSPRPRLPRGRVGPGPKPQGPTSPARHLGPRHCPWSLDAHRPLPGKAPWGGGSQGSPGILPSHTWPAHVLPVGSRGRKRSAGRQPGETSHRGAVPPPHTQGTILGSLTPVAPKTLRGPITCHGLLRPCQGRRGSARPGLSPAQPLVPPSPVPSP